MEGIFLELTMDIVYLWQNNYATGYTFGAFLRGRVQGVKRFATHPRHFPSQVPSPPGPKI